MGGAAVMLFFVISAFSIYLSLDKRNNESNRSLKFYLRRLFRIAPLFYFLIPIYIAFNVIKYGKIFSVGLILLNITFAFNFHPLYFESIVWAGWVIGVEMIFYFLAPFFYSTIKSLRMSIPFAIWAMIFSIAFNSLLKPLLKHSLALNPDKIDNYLYMNFVSQLPVFAIGIISYFVYKDFIAKKFPRAVTIRSLLLLIPIIAMLLYKKSYICYHLIPIHYLYALAFSFLIIYLALYPNKLFVNPITCFYGKISYSTYLIHPLLIYMLVPTYRYIYNLLNLNVIITFFACFFLTVLILTPISLFSYYLIETPFIRYGKRVIAWL